MAAMPRSAVILGRVAPLLLLAALAACGSPARPPSPAAALGPTSRHPGLTCAPFARELSGIALYGEAAAWWEAAGGQYQRGSRPEVGAVLVFRREPRLPSGHVAVVSKVLTPRQVLVFQANWVPDELDQDQLVVDVSERNDWSELRVWYPPIAQLGAHTYPAYGFILPPRPATHEELEQAAQPAAVYAISSHGRQPPRARTFGS
jgi:surface antigen